MKVIGSISYNPLDIVGQGSSSVVYKGRLGNRDVAVKRVPTTSYKLIKSEIELLEKSDRDPHIIRYFLTEQDANYQYIALELCVGTLRHFVADSNMKSKISNKTIIEEMLSGMEFLHQLGICHRDIKPTNVLLFQKSPSELEVKISDFGFAKMLDSRRGSEMSVVPDESNYWTVPEMSKGHYNMKSDVYSIGALIYFIANDGNLPNIGNTMSFDLLSSPKFKDSSSGVLLRHLITVMTRLEPQNRPSIKCLRFHPFFWDGQKVLNFLITSADRIKINDSLAYAAKSELQENAANVIGNEWTSRLESEIISSLAYRSSRHNYGTSSISELLRAMRNKAAHYDEMTPQAKQTYGPMPEGFASYWTSKFPPLVLHVYLKLYKCGIRGDSNFKENYYPVDDKCNTARSS